jgi:hypothetical protein
MFSQVRYEFVIYEFILDSIPQNFEIYPSITQGAITFNLQCQLFLLSYLFHHGQNYFTLCSSRFTSVDDCLYLTVTSRFVNVNSLSPSKSLYHLFIHHELYSPAAKFAHLIGVRKVFLPNSYRIRTVVKCPQVFRYYMNTYQFSFEGPLQSSNRDIIRFTDSINIAQDITFCYSRATG